MEFQGWRTREDFVPREFLFVEAGGEGKAGKSGCGTGQGFGKDFLAWNSRLRVPGFKFPLGIPGFRFRLGIPGREFQVSNSQISSAPEEDSSHPCFGFSE